LVSRTTHRGDIQVNVDSWRRQLFSTLIRLFILCVFFPGLFWANHTAAHAQSVGTPFGGQIGEDTGQGSIEAANFHFNDLYTTPFGPAYADIWLAQQNFLACRPPVGRPFSYALCFFSGPAIGTPVPTDGSASVNPPLPCTLSEDGKSANSHVMRSRRNNIPPMSPILSASTRS